MVLFYVKVCTSSTLWYKILSKQCVAFLDKVAPKCFVVAKVGAILLMYPCPLSFPRALASLCHEFSALMFDQSLTPMVFDPSRQIDQSHFLQINSKENTTSVLSGSGSDQVGVETLV